MSSEILINSAIGETRFALLEQGKAVEIRLFRDHDPSLVGAVYHGRITSLSKAFQAAFIDLGTGVTGFLPLSTLPKRPGRKPQDLTTLLHEGQKIIVQVSADAVGDKLTKLTGRIEITTPALILHPFRDGAFVSSRIKDPVRRQQLKQFAAELDSHGYGFTLKPQAAALGNEEIRRAVDHLVRHWTRVSENRAKNKVPFLLSQGPDSLLQILRDYGDRQLDNIVF
ncbi:MAG: S1 RNA-binding domain-containing protein, partial [Alphaproteobacteria bacterium]|nr:S1 RNA-binding domain-containing protein [Alphaproteobacteria bacterium]